MHKTVHLFLLMAAHCHTSRPMHWQKHIFMKTAWVTITETVLADWQQEVAGGTTRKQAINLQSHNKHSIACPNCVIVRDYLHISSVKK